MCVVCRVLWCCGVCFCASVCVCCGVVVLWCVCVFWCCGIRLCVFHLHVNAPVLHCISAWISQAISWCSTAITLSCAGQQLADRSGHRFDLRACVCGRVCACLMHCKRCVHIADLARLSFEQDYADFAPLSLHLNPNSTSQALLTLPEVS